MASLSKSGKGKIPSRLIQFADPRDGNRKTIRLGKCGLEPARDFKRRVEELLGCVVANRPADAQLETWLAGLTADAHAKLAVVGLTSPRVPPPTAPTLAEWTARFFAQLGDDPIHRPWNVYATQPTFSCPASGHPSRSTKSA